jgi:hypothetical protein
MNDAPVQRPAARYGRYVGLLALFIVALITLNTILTKPNGSKGIEVGHAVPPFAVPLVTGKLSGDADIAAGAHEGSRGAVAACQERGAEILNICQLYERGPVVLALFLDAGSCAAVLGDVQSIAGSFPSVQFAAVALKGGRSKLRRLVSSHGLHIPVGEDRDGSLLGLYKMASCPQVSFIYPGGVVQSPALLVRPAISTLRARVAQLVAASRTRGLHPAGAA